MCFTIGYVTEKRLSKTLKLPRLARLESLGSFKISASFPEAATFRLGLVSVSAQKVSCTFVIIMHQNISSVLLISRMTSRNLDVLGYVKSFTVKTNEKMHSRSSRSGCWGAYTIFSF